MQSLVFSGKGKCALQAERGELTYVERSPHLLLVCPHVNEDSKSLQFDWSQKHYPDWSQRNHSDWLVKVLMAYSCTALVEWGKSQL